MNRMILLAVAVTWLGAVPAAGQSAAGRIIDQDVKVGLPPTPCTVIGMAVRIAQVVGEPVGTERWPEPCPVPPLLNAAGTVEWLTLTGLNAREALDRLMQVDSRYEWREMDGVIVVRPRIAWTDTKHFLHRTVSSFTVRDKHLSSTLEAVIDAFGPFHWRPEVFIKTTPQADRVVSLNLGNTSIIEILNTVVRTHGAMAWNVTYCRSAAIHENAWFRFFTFDGGGTSRPAFPDDVDGERHSACLDQGSR